MDASDEARESAVVPAVHAPHAVTFLRSLAARGVHTVGVYERPTPAFRSRHCHEARIVPDPETDADGYRDALLSLARRESTRAVVPMREADVYVLSKFESSFETAVTPLWPAFDRLETVHDRVQLTTAAREAGVSTPETSRLAETEDWESRQIVKSRYALLAGDYTGGRADGLVEPSSSVHYVAAGAMPDVEAVRSELSHPLVQEYVPGDEYAFWALYEDGEPVATCQKHQLRAFSYTGGTSVCRETVDIPALEAAGRSLLEHLDWTGFASVQFKRDDRTGEFTLLEVNPRVWVSVSCPVLAGVDFPDAYWRLATGGRDVAAHDYETGVTTHRLGGELQYLLSVLREDDTFVEAPPVRRAVREVLWSLYRHPYFDYLATDDPGPFVSDLAGWASRKTRTWLERTPRSPDAAPSE
jgi:predicted ATP-grasp superfamily ATP-dependent carboligase